jgi:hypothetical protein
MADDELGSAALRRVVESTRAKAGGVGQFAPAPPADPVSAPWLQLQTPEVVAPPANGRVRSQPIAPAIQRRAGVIAGLPTKHHEQAWTLAHAMLKHYGKEMGGNLARADLHLAQELMESGTLLLRYGVPMDNLGALIRLARDLAHQGAADGAEDPRIDALRKSMERAEPEEDALGPAVDDGLEQGEDDGE